MKENLEKSFWLSIIIDILRSHINGVIYSIKSIYRHSMDETAINQLIR